MVSLIVPVYNAEKYIERCVNSIINQSYSDWELILIDDCSTDNSLEICNKLALIDKRIRVEGQENSGPAGARNHGLKMAKGDYVTFVDADDYIEDTFLEYLLGLIKENDCEMSSCGWNVRDYNGDCIGRSPEFDKHIFNLMEDYRDKYTIPYTVWHSMYSMNVIKENGIWFDETVFYLEDLLFNFSYMRYVNRFINTCEPLYNWIDNPNSLTRSPMDDGKFKKWYTKIEAREKLCKMDIFNKIVIDANYDSLLFESAMMLADIRKNNIDAPEEENHVRDNIQRYRKRVFRHHSSFSIKRKIRLFFLCYMGIELKRGMN